MSFASDAVASGDETDGLLDECVAGINANIALIECGTATYHQRISMPRIRAEKPRERKLRVVFDYPFLHFELSEQKSIGAELATVTERTTINGDHRIQYWPGAGGSRVPNANIVVIEPNVPSRRALINPRHQRHGQWGDPPSFAYEIANMRTTAAGQLLTWRRAEGLIEISLNATTEQRRGTYWVSPEQGYALVRAKEWGALWDGEEPTHTYEATFRQANNGAFVLSYRHERNCGVENSVLTPWLEDEWWLDEIDLGTRPPEKAFTLEGLDLPVGAPIHDTVRGRSYRYGIPGVDEQGVEACEPNGPMRLRSWIDHFNTAVAAAFLLWFGNRLARWHDRRRYPAS